MKVFRQIEKIYRLKELIALPEEQLRTSEVYDELLRILHNMKGTLAMFGYKAAADIVHTLESDYEDFRAGQKDLHNFRDVFAANLKELDVALNKGVDSSSILDEDADN